MLRAQSLQEVLIFFFLIEKEKFYKIFINILLEDTVTSFLFEGFRTCQNETSYHWNFEQYLFSKNSFHNMWNIVFNSQAAYTLLYLKMHTLK